MLLKIAKSNQWVQWIARAASLIVLLLAAQAASAAPCDLKNNPPAFIRHDLGASYCELCSYGYITIIISNPYEGADMTGMTVVENLLSSGLTFEPTAPSPVTYSINGGPLLAGAAPGVSGANGSVLTWTSFQLPALARLEYQPGNNNIATLAITFAVSRAGTLTQEGLVSASRNIQASLTYSAEDATGPLPHPLCPSMPATVATGIDTIALREPDPVVAKGGRNVDAAQGSYTATVYGNDKDDIIWRVRITNNGDADLQDLVFGDLMQSGNLDINYICSTEPQAEAVAIAGNGAIGAYPGCTDVRALSNNIAAFDVDDPFGYDDLGPDLIDVLASAPADIFLVGKIPDSAAGIGACSAPRTNTVSNVQWGCESESATPGGIDRTSTGSPLGAVAATLSSQSDRDLDINVAYLGYPGNPVTGARGRVRITIVNNSGGTVSDLVLTNDLPPEYMVDATHPVTIAATGAYGYYPGLTNQITWDNPNADPLLNNIPQFTLTSSAATNSGQTNLLRNGDQLVVTFGIVLVRPGSYDKVADLDVITEVPAAAIDGTDPNHAQFLADLDNNLTVQFNDFCTGGPNTDTDFSQHTPLPEDLDIQTYGPSGPVLDYILTNNTSTTLTVRLTNNGGHGAEDYFGYVAFGRTMHVDETQLPAGCSATLANMPPLVEWQDPLGFPPGAAIYECTGPEIARNGGTRDFDFVVNKSGDPADIAADDLTFRADVIGEITLYDGTRLTFPTVTARGDGITDRANNYTIDAIRARVMGFNLNKAQVGNCSENNPPPGSPDVEVQIGEECAYNIEAGGWFGFLTPGYTPIEVRNVRVDDVMPNGQGYVSSTDPTATSTTQIDNIAFNRVGGPVPPNWSLLGDLQEGTLFWTFNDAGSYITTRDEWFLLDVKTRLLNDPVNASGVPNQHAALSTNTLTSTFDVYFLVGTGDEFDVPYGPGMSVYPPVANRQVSLTVTEPNITVVKEVCNETLYGSGPSCSNWVTLASDGDALNSYIYRLTVTNEGAAGSPLTTRAPAYDVTVTDTLDASDLAYVLPLGSDGLDNDGDTASDGADAGGEGAISDNTVDNATPAVITFSYTHSTALARIDPGTSVRLYYRVDFDDDAAPLQTFTNSAVATYDTLAGPTGNQTAGLERPNGNIAGARVYSSPTSFANVRIIPIQTQPKRIVALSNTPLAGSGTQGVSIGEEIDYRLNTLLPVALLRSFVIRDELPAGIICSQAPVLDLGPTGPYAAAGFVPNTAVTPTCTGTTVEWNFGDRRITAGTAGLGNRYDFEIGFIARVENTAGNNNANVISNGDPATNATARYVDETGATITQNFNQVDVQVREPRIDLTKSFAVANADAADVLTVTVTATNRGTATAYNLRVLDDLTGRHMTFTGNVGGGNPPDTIDTTTLGANRPIFSWNPPNGIAPGGAISFTFTVSVDGVVQPQELLANTIQADWTSLPGQTTALNSSGTIGADGSANGMRIGALPNAGDAINDYETEASDNLSVPAVTLTKTDLSPGATPTIGTHKTFRIDIALPEGTTHNVTVTDSLNAAGLSYVLENNAPFDITYTFQGIATINDQPPGESVFNAFPADGAAGDVVWDIGKVVTQTENDPTQSSINPLIRIDYAVRINNDAATDAGDTLQNNVVLTYTNGATGAPESLTDSTALLTVVEPSLTLAKFAANLTNPGNPPQAGDILRYTLTFTAAGGAPGDLFSDAFDLRIDDSLSLGLVYNGNPTVGGAGNTIGAPVVTGDGVTTAQTLRWSLEDGNADIDISEGATVDITYDVRVLDSVLLDQILSNSAMAQWTSLDDPSGYERDGTAAPAYNDYFTGPATTAVVVGGTNTVAKSRLTDTYGAGDANVRIGDIVEYELRLGLAEGTHGNVFVIDTLPRGLQFEGIAGINGDTSAPFAAVAPFVHGDVDAADVVVAGNAATGPTTVTVTLGTVVNQADGNPANNDFVIIYRARVLNAVHPQVNTIGLTNTVAMGYDTASGPATTITDNEIVTVLQPNLSVAKSAVAAGGDTVLAADEVVTYTVDITNSGSAPAYDAVLQDIIPLGMRNGTATITVLSLQLLSGAVLPNLAPVYDAATGTATWNFDTGIADQYSIPAGDTLRIVYRVQADTGLGAGLSLTNQAQVQVYYSLDDEGVPTDGGVTGVAEVYGPTNTAATTFTTDAAGALTKANPAVLSAAVGEPFTYRITVPATPLATALHDVRILDDLSASAADLSFVSVTKVSGSQTWTPVNTGTATNLVIEDTITGIEIPAGEQIEVDITVMLADTAANVSGLQFNNTAAYTFDQMDNDPGTQVTGGSDTTGNMTIVGPDTLTLEKSGPATMQVGTPETFTLDVHNTGTGTAWNATIVDRLPNGVDGGTCGTGPANVTARIFEADGTTLLATLVQDTDYQVNFSGAPVCEWTLNLLPASGGLPPTQRLILTYDVSLDPTTLNGIALTNIAGVTQWYSFDPTAADAAPRPYTHPLTDGTPGTLDTEDAHTIDTQAAVLQFLKRVRNATTGQDPGTDASPGDTLHYTLEITNSGPVGLADFSISDDLDGLNATPVFVPGTLSMPSLPSGVNPVGGVHGTGMVSVGSLSIGPQGAPDDTVVLEFDVTLVPVIASGTIVLNQAGLTIGGLAPLLSDDPNLPGSTDPTQTTITSAPDFQVQKSSAYISGDPTVLLAGETLRYTITIRNIGDEDAVNVRFRDFTPANTTYVANSTTLNGNAVPDAVAGVSPLITGIAINAPGDPAPGNMPADAAGAVVNTAIVTFDVVVDPDAMDGLVISNQGFVSGDGTGSGTRPDQPSDDPGTAVPDDPTLDVVGNLPLLYARKTVVISQDGGTTGIVDPGDRLLYTITVSNTSAIPATGVVITDDLDQLTPPANQPLSSLVTYVAGSGTLNGSSAGVTFAGNLLTADYGTTYGDLPAGQSAVVTFEVTVNAGAQPGDVISNQGSLTSNELPAQLTDADGLPGNGFQPTIIVVGNAQLVTVTKSVAVVGGGAAVAGAQLEYTIRVTNPGPLPATNVIITDDLSPPLGDQVTYIAGSATLNGATSGVTFVGSLLTAVYGDLPAGASAEVRFRVQIDPALATGTTITNTGVAQWNTPAQTDSASVSIDVGGTPGSGTLNGSVWHDVDLDRAYDGGEQMLQGWSVALYRNSQLVATATTDAGGVYQFGGLLPNQGTADLFELRFSALGAGPNAAALGNADSVFTNGPHRISDIVVSSGANLQNLNLPIQPNGTVYDSVVRVPVSGARLAMLNAATGTAVSNQCFDDPNQQNQVTAAEGFYKFDLNFSDGSCPAGGAYLIEVTSPATGYLAAPSQIIPPDSDATTAPFSVPACPGSPADAVPATPGYCEAVSSPAVPPVSVPPRTAGTIYHLHLLLNDGSLPGQSQIFNNPIPLDPVMSAAAAITKTTSSLNVTRGTLVPYTITVTNVFGVPLYDIRIIDRFPAGFKYVEGSARLNGQATEPRVSGRELAWDGLDMQVNAKITIKLLLVVGSGVTEDEYVNRAVVYNSAINSAISGEATATVRVIPDPDFDCTDIIGKVFDDGNLNGRQDDGEKGLAGVRLVTVRGLIATTDPYGRFHITCAALPDEDRGSNFILKLDERSLPSGYRLTTENPRVQRATRGKMMRFNFGAAILRVVRIDIAEGVFEPESVKLRLQWEPRIGQLLDELQKAPSVLRLSYLADIEPKSLVHKRLETLKELIANRWEAVDGGYPLTIETEVFWRRGASFNKR